MLRWRHFYRQSKARNSPPVPMAGRCSAPQDSQAPPHGTVPWEDKQHHSQHPPHPPSAASDAECDRRYSGIFLGSAVLAVPTALCTPSPGCWGEEQKQLGSVSALLSSDKTLLSFQRFLVFAAQLQTTAPYYLL